MTRDSEDLPRSSSASDLRYQAVTRLRESQSTRQPDDPQRVLHELQVHQIELEIQNETLISTQRQLESTLQQLSNLFDFAPIPYLRLDARGGILNANYAAAEFFQMDRTSLGQSHLKSFFPPDVLPAFWAFLTLCLDTGQRQTLEIQASLDGKSSIVLLQAITEPDAPSLLLSVTDISHIRIIEQSTSVLANSLGKQFDPKTNSPATLAYQLTLCEERLHLEQELLTHQRMLETAEHLAQVGAWTYDVNDNVLTPSREWLRIMGINTRALSLEEFLSLFHPEERERMSAVIDNLLRNNENIDLKSRILRRENDEIVHVHTMARGTVDRVGQVIEIQGATQDISQRYLMERQISDQLHQLEESDRHKDEFLAMLSHELRNPLTPLTIAAHLLQKGGLSEDKLDWCHRMIEQQSRQLTRLVDDLLDVSRITRGKIELDRQCVDLAMLMKEAIQACKIRLESVGLSISVHMPVERIELDADPIRLIQVINNLLENAAKFSPQGGRVSIRIESQEGEAVISVADTGIGLEPEALSQVFDLFTQINQSEYVSNPGLGIGLHLCKQLVELHGGKISVRSEGLGRGSEFLVRLPVCGPIGDLQEQGSADRAPPAYRLLIVDDHTEVTESLKILLQGAGHEIHVAHSGQEALALAETFQPELIMLDIGMPDMDGYETCKRLRRQPWSASIPIVALTGWGMAEDKRRSQQAGFTLHITKPVAPETFQKVLEELLPGRSSHS